MSLDNLNQEFVRMQTSFGDSNLDAIISGGHTDRPDIALVFMNPTGKNVASSKDWSGLKAPWLGTKNIWSLFRDIGILDEYLYSQIRANKPADWTPEFAAEIYDNLASRRIYVTNLAKCTQTDARPLPDSVYSQYLDLFRQELGIIKPKATVLFGNQVSSIVLDQKISVSQVRKQLFKRDSHRFYSVFYPVGNGRFNIEKSIEDLRWILENET